MRSAYIPIVFSFCKWTFKLRKWFSPLSQYTSASSFRLAKIDHSKMSEIVASLRFLLFVFDFSFLTVLYSTKNKITHCTKKTIKKCNFKLKKIRFHIEFLLLSIKFLKIMAIVSEVLQDTSVLLLYRSSLRHNPVAAYTTSSDSFFNSSTECFASWGLPYFIVVPLISLYPWHSVFACDSCICCLIAN